MAQSLSTKQNPYGPLLAAAIGRIVRKKARQKELSTEQFIRLVVKETGACRASVIEAIRSSPPLKKHFLDLPDDDPDAQTELGLSRPSSTRSAKATGEAARPSER